MCFDGCGSIDPVSFLPNILAPSFEILRDGDVTFDLLRSGGHPDAITVSMPLKNYLKFVGRSLLLFGKVCGQSIHSQCQSQSPFANWTHNIEVAIRSHNHI